MCCYSFMLKEGHLCVCVCRVLAVWLGGGRPWVWFSNDLLQDAAAAVMLWGFCLCRSKHASTLNSSRCLPAWLAFLNMLSVCLSVSTGHFLHGHTTKIDFCIGIQIKQTHHPGALRTRCFMKQPTRLGPDQSTGTQSPAVPRFSGAPTLHASKTSSHSGFSTSDHTLNTTRDLDFSSFPPSLSPLLQKMNPPCFLQHPSSAHPTRGSCSPTRKEKKRAVGPTRSQSNLHFSKNRTI